MIRTGLVSITFRKLTAGEIVELVRQAGLAGIEWGGDVHVPHGDLHRAREARAMTAEAGLTVAAYGSYYRAGAGEALRFEEVLATAVELGAPLIRVWAGKLGSGEADAACRAAVAADSQRIADLAAGEGIKLAYEFHRKTLTDSAESAVALLRAVGRDNLLSYWQPPGGLTSEDCLRSLGAVLPWLTNLHVYQSQAGERLPLAEGEAAWRRYFDLARTSGRDHYALIEFVRQDSPAAFLEDAATLRGWLEAPQPF